MMTIEINGMQADRERLTMLLFEQFNIAGLFMCEQSIMSLYSVGKTSGTVVDLGHGKTGELWHLTFMTHAPLVRFQFCCMHVHISSFSHVSADIAPVIEGQVYYPAARRLSYGGEDVTEYLRRLLQQQQDTAFREAPRSELQGLKEECIRVAESKEAALSEVCLPKL